MQGIPILRMGEFLLVTIQVDMHDQLAMRLQDDLTNAIAKKNAKGALQAVWIASTLVDKLAQFTATTYQRSREEVIQRQQIGRAHV